MTNLSNALKAEQELKKAAKLHRVARSKLKKCKKSNPEYKKIRQFYSSSWQKLKIAKKNFHLAMKEEGLE
jgi:hypothetical protein